MTKELPMAGSHPEFDEAEIRREVKRYKALGDETRLKIFRVLESGAHCVCELMDIFHLSQPTVSHHLKILENAGLVQGYRVGKFVYYQLVPGGS